MRDAFRFVLTLRWGCDRALGAHLESWNSDDFDACRPGTGRRIYWPAIRRSRRRRADLRKPGRTGDFCGLPDPGADPAHRADRSEEHTSELQSRRDLVCRLLLEKKKKSSYPTQPLYRPNTKQKT